MKGLKIDFGKGDTKMKGLKIDFEKVKTVEDVIQILKALDLGFDAKTAEMLKGYLKEAKE